MRISLMVTLLFLIGCKHMGLLFEPPATLKAVVQGEIKGMAIHCEKTLTLGNARWEVLCKVSDDIDIKYRTQTINHKQTKLEILIDKQSAGHKKTLAAPMVIVNQGKPARMEMVSDKARI